MPYHKDIARSITVIVGYRILSEICAFCKSGRTHQIGAIHIAKLHDCILFCKSRAHLNKLHLPH